MRREEAVLGEYEKAIELFMNESRIAWELVSIWVVAQVGLASAFALLYAQKVEWGSLAYATLFAAGLVSNLAWIPMQ